MSFDLFVCLFFITNEKKMYCYIEVSDYVSIWSTGYERNFEKLTPNSSTTFNAPYDYLSVMHYGKKYFSKNSENTIATKLPQYQDKIGQRMEMSPTDVYKLNRLYNCSKL